MKKIKILYLIDVFYEFAGAERNLYELVKHIDKDKYIPFVFALKGGNRLDEFSKIGVAVKSLEIKKIYSIQGIKKIIEVIRFIRSEEIKMIVSYHEGADSLAFLAGKLAGVKVLISSRRDMGYKLKRRHIFIYRLINRYFNKIITVSNAVSEVIGKREKVEKDKLFTIYNGVDFSKVENAVTYTENELREVGVPKARYYVGVMATYRKVKGIEFFIKAAGIISQKRKDIKFLIIGKPQNITVRMENRNKELEELAAASESSDSVIFVNFQRDIYRLLKMLDVSVLPSLSEGFSNIIIESMASGKPVVATSVGGNIEAVVEGETGLLVPPADEKALAEAIIKLIDNPELREKMGKEARKIAQAKFNINKMMQNIEMLYEYLLDYREVQKSKHVIRRLSIYFLSYFLYYFGILKLYMRYQKGKGSLIILAYHNIVKENKAYLNLAIKDKLFKKHLQSICKYFKLISLKEAVDLLESGKWKGNFATITFDDGYKAIYHFINNNYGDNMPPFTIFINSQTLEKGKLLWFDKLVHAISNSRSNIIDLRKYNLGIFLLNSQKSKHETCAFLAEMLKNIYGVNKEHILTDILGQLGVEEFPSTSEIYLNKEEIEDLINKGVIIGSHSVSHPILSKIDINELEYEIKHSKKYLEDNFNIQVDYFAYPNGEHADFDNRAIDVLASSGYKNAFTLVKGENDLPYQIGRLGIYGGYSFHEPVFVSLIVRHTGRIIKQDR